MKDILKTIRDYLAAQATLTGAPGNVGTRIYAGITLPKDYNPAKGNAILFNVQGSIGAPQDYSSQIFQPSIQFLCFGSGSDSEAQANSTAIAKALYDCLHDMKGSPAGLRSARQSTMPQLLNDPETGWAYTLVFYDLMIANV